MIQLSDCNLSVGLLNLASAAKSIILLPCTAGDAYSQRDFDFAAPNRRCLLGLLLKILDALGPSLARCAIKGGRDRRAGLEDSGGPYGQGRRSSFVHCRGGAVVSLDVAADLPPTKIRRERTLMDAESMSRRMSVSAAIALLSDRHGDATACKIARLEQLKARRARSRKRFDFWTAVATQMQQGRLGCEPAQNSN